jgi:hypothetical protein
LVTKKDPTDLALFEEVPDGDFVSDDEFRLEMSDEEVAQKLTLAERFLDTWDRQIPEDKRVYGTKLCFAGGEDRKLRDGLYRIGVRHILLSFYYFKKFMRKRSPAEISDDIGRFDFVLLDSGGFTFMQALKEGRDTNMGIREYADLYHSELERKGHIFTACAELDVHEEFSQQEMEDVKDRLTAAGIPMMPVMHGQSVGELEDLGWFDKYPYMAVGSALLWGRKVAPELKEYIKKAKEVGTLLHGFGITTVDAIRTMPFYSVDSTTWMGGTRYGNTMIFQNGRLRYYDFHKKSVRRRYRKRFEDNGLIWADIDREKPLEVDLMNALGWKQWSDYIRYTVQNCYWLTAEEKDAALSIKAQAFNTEGLMSRSASLARAQARRLVQTDDAQDDDRAHEMLHCDTCNMEGRCPRFKAGEVCGYDVNVRLSTNVDLQRALQNVLEVEYGRVMTGALFEKLEGGVLDANVTNELKNFIKLVGDAKNMFNQKHDEELRITAKGKEAGSVSKILASVLSPRGSGTSGSGSTKTQRAANEVIDVSPVDSDSD